MENVTVGVVGLGRMGFAIAQRLVAAGLTVYGYDAHQPLAAQAQQAGIKSCSSLAALAEKARFVWLMVPAGQIVDDVIAAIKPHCMPNSIVIDGGNSF